MWMCCKTSRIWTTWNRFYSIDAHIFQWSQIYIGWIWKQIKSNLICYSLGKMFLYCSPPCSYNISATDILQITIFQKEEEENVLCGFLTATCIASIVYVSILRITIIRKYMENDIIRTNEKTIKFNKISFRSVKTCYWNRRYSRDIPKLSINSEKKKKYPHSIWCFIFLEDSLFFLSFFFLTKSKNTERMVNFKKKK